MNLRCKPGDLAVIVSNKNPENVGGMVRVIEHDAYWDAILGGHTWAVVALRPLKTNLGQWKTNASIRDASLKPIRPDALPEHQTTDEEMAA